MDNTWVIVAESSRAKIFAMDSPRAPLREIGDFVHPAARQHERDLTTDLPGRTFDSGGEGRHAKEPATGPREHEAQVFARQLGDYLESARTGNRFTHLVVVAAPAFLGLLRKHLSEATNRLVIQEIDKNLVRHEAAEIRAHLPERFPPGS